MMPEKLDIHNYELNLECCKRKIKKTDISDANKKLIFDYDRARQLDGTAIATRIRTIYCLLDLAKFFGKEMDKAGKEDVKDFIYNIESKKDYGVWTKSKFKGVTKKFFTSS